jgi:hypothetical protein
VLCCEEEDLKVRQHERQYGVYPRKDSGATPSKSHLHRSCKTSCVDRGICNVHAHIILSTTFLTGLPPFFSFVQPTSDNSNSELEADEAIRTLARLRERGTNKGKENNFPSQIPDTNDFF